MTPLLLILLAPLIAQVEPAAASLPVELSYGDALQYLLASLGGLKGAGALAIAAAVTQGVMRLFQSPLGTLAGRWRWLAYSGVSLVAGVLTMKLSGVDWVTALVSSTTLTGVVNWLHQASVQLPQVVKPDQKAA